jgi:hypothetical protein
VRLRVFFATLALAAAACGPASTEEVGEGYVGLVDGTDARIAAIVSGDRATVFACGGRDTYATLTHWFDATALGAGFEGEAAGGSVALAPEGEGFAGTLTVGAVEHPLRLAPDDQAVLFVADVDGRGRAGVIAHADGDGRSTQGAFVWGDGTRSQIFVVRQPEARGFLATVASPDGSTFRVAVAPLRAPRR